ncbi:MAG: hypothetical protein ACI85K_001441 [Hyphomicrobiaceae bacterium]|jgi:hypothetical protein
MVRCMTGCISGAMVGMFVLWGMYNIVNPAWLEFHGVRVGVDLAVVVCAGIAGGWLACRSLSACRYLSAFALAATPLVLMVLWVAAMMDAWGVVDLPDWAWGVPLLTLLSGVVGIRSSRRVPRRRLPSQPNSHYAPGCQERER